MFKRIQLIIFSLSIIATLFLSTGVVSAGTQFNVPSCWILSSSGVSIDSNCDGVVDFANYASIANPLVYYNQTQVNALITSLNNSKLDKTDQRYNETGLINSVNSTVNQLVLDNTSTNARVTEVNATANALNTSKLDKTDQRFNETALIVSVNNSFYLYLNDYYNASQVDVLIAAVNNTALFSNYYNKSESDLRYLQLTDQRFNETGLIMSVNSTVNALVSSNTTTNSRIDSLNLSKLDKTDQRYNDTALINAVNTTNNIQSLSFYNTTQVDSLVSAINNSGSLVNYYNKTDIDAQQLAQNNSINSTNVRVDSLNSTKMNFDGSNSNVSLLKFNINGTPCVNEGEVSYITGQGLSVCYPLGTTLQVGNELYTIVTNLDSVTLLEGTAVSVQGVSGNREGIVRTNISDHTSAHDFLGIVTSANCTVNEKCFVTTYGDVNAIDTDNYTEGVPLYVSSTLGGLSNSLPNPPAHIIQVGAVKVKNANVGVIAVRPQVTGSISESSDVDGTPTNTTGQILVWNNTGQYWDASDNINNYLLKTDQRFNETALATTANNTANSINSSVYATYTAVRDPTGFRDRTTSTISFNNNTRNVSLTGTYPIYIDGKVQTFSNLSVVIGDSTGLHFVYMDDFSGLKTSTVPWNFESIVQVVTIYWNNVTKQGIIGDERHGIAMDWQTHEYLHETIGTRYANGLAGVFNNTAFTIGTGEYYDEDLEYKVTSTLNTCDLYYRMGTDDTWLSNQTQYYYKNATNMYYDNGGNLTAVPANQFMAIWVFATNNPLNPIGCVLGQRVDTNVANARTNNAYESLVLDVPLAEFKLLYRVIIDNDVSPYVETLDYRAVSTVSSGNYVATDHGTLSGLSDDDHLQYVLVDGTRAMTTLTVTGNITENGALLNTKYNETALINSVNATVTQLVNDNSTNTARINSLNSSKVNYTNPFAMGTFTLNGGFGSGNGTSIQGGNYFGDGNIYILGNITAVNLNYVNTNISNSTSALTFYENSVSLVNKYVSLTNLVSLVGNWSAVSSGVLGNISGLQSSNTTTNSRIDGLNSTKALSGASSICTYGIANITLNTDAVPTVTCAAQQGTVTQAQLDNVNATAQSGLGLATTANGTANTALSLATSVNATVSTLNNLSMTQIASNIGNWSADKSSYALDSRVTTVNGTAQTALSLATTANGTANTANTTANTALSLATLANTTANTANSTANSHTLLISGIQSNVTAVNVTAVAALPKINGTVTGTFTINATTTVNANITMSSSNCITTSSGGKIC